MGEVNQMPASNNKDDHTWMMILHLSQLANFVIPFAGLVLPIVIWHLKKDEIEGLDEHGKAVFNWMISALIFGFISAILLLVFVGFFCFIILGLLTVIFPVIGGIKASSGILWKYPLSLKIF